MGLMMTLSLALISRVDTTTRTSRENPSVTLEKPESLAVGWPLLEERAGREKKVENFLKIWHHRIFFHPEHKLVFFYV